MSIQGKIGDGAVGDRRRFLRGVGLAGAVLTGCAAARSAKRDEGEHDKQQEVEISPGEDLMQEHGVVLRILQIYEEAARRLEFGRSFEPATIASAATIIRRFVEDYHEKNEEELVFPRLQAANREGDLIAALLAQHQRGRQITDVILQRTKARSTSDLVKYLRGFSRMYRPHIGYEDTVIFPAFRQVVGRGAYSELGERFEQREHQLVGEHGFEKTVAEIARLEQAMDIANLARYTMP